MPKTQVNLDPPKPSNVQEDGLISHQSCACPHQSITKQLLSSTNSHTMKLFAFGSNGSGQLGIGHLDDVSIPTPCLFATDIAAADTAQEKTNLTDILDDDIAHIAAGGNHTLLLTKSGAVYVSGCNIDGRCGPQYHDQDEDGNISHFRRFILNDSITGAQILTFKCVSATWEGTIAVASTPQSRGMQKEDKVYVCGPSPKGTLTYDTAAPIQPGTSVSNFPPEGTNITSLSSSMAHTIAILSNGDVYGWGGSRKGQLGAKSRDSKIVCQPMKVDVPFLVKGGACGREFSVVWGFTGEVCVFAESKMKWGVMEIPRILLGSGDSDQDACGGVRGRIPFASAGIGASWHGVYVHVAPASGLNPVNGTDAQQDADSASHPHPGSIIAWGRNDRGQLPPLSLPSTTCLAIGSEHVLALLEEGQVASFGWGEHGNCGPETDPQGNVSGTYNIVPLPDTASAAGERVIGVGAGCATSFMLVS
jgi:protein ATS1